MFPVEASRELQIRVFHRLGRDQHVLTLQLQSGDDVRVRVLEPFQQGRLPSCLYRSTLEYAALAVRESLADPEASQAAPDAPGRAAALASLGEGLLDLEERRWPRLLGHAGLPAPTREATFWCAYDFLLRHRPAFFRTIGLLEDSYLKGIRDLQVGRLTAISELQRCQSMEMEKVRQQAETAAEAEEEEDGTVEDVKSLVAQHVSEIDAVELHWRTEIEQLKVRQKASYCDLIVDFFEQEIELLRQAQSGAAGDGQEGPPEATPGGRPEGPPLGAGDADAAAAELRDRLARPLQPCPPRALQSLPTPAAHAGAVAAASDAAPEEAAPRGRGRSLSRARGVSPERGGRSLSRSASTAPRGREGREGRPTRDGGGGLRLGRNGRLTEHAVVRSVFGQRRVFVVLRLCVGDIMDLLHATPSPEEGEDRDGWPTDDIDGAGPQLPPELLGVASYGHGYFARGSGLPLESQGWPRFRPTSADGGTPPFAMGCPGAMPGLKGRGVLQSPTLHFWKPAALSPPVGLSPNAYADRLRGLVIPTPENLKYEATQAVMLREFSRRCERVTDLHFPPMAAQLQRARDATADAPLRSGDYFCTRHSNLGGAVQAAFHLLTTSSEAPASDEVSPAMHRALKRIILDCHRCRVAELSLPLLLLDIGTSESSLPYAVAQRRAENALRALKGALTRLADELAPSEAPGLQVLNLVLPQSCAQSIKSGIPTVVDTTLTFLQHSFQCV